jgi:tetratricopeptide (TPR) repeat protein
MPHPNTPNRPGKSFEIIPPDTGVWKPPPQVSLDRPRPPWLKLTLRLAGLLILAAVIIGGHRLWQGSSQSAPAEPNSSMVSVLPARLLSGPGPASPTTPAVRPELPKETHIRLAPAGEVPASLYASTLDAIRLTIEQGNDAEAEGKLLALPKEAFTDQRVQAYTAVLWNNLGVKQKASRGAAAAIAAFKTAISLDPAQAEAYRNLVRVYMERNDAALSRELLEKTIALSPDDPWAHLALADLLYNKEDVAGAVMHLDQATGLATRYPETQTYLKFITYKVKGTQKAEQKLLDRESAHFRVKFEGGEDYEIWGRVVEILEDAYRDIGQQLGYFPSKPIVVVLLTKQTFHGETGGPAWSDALFDPVQGRIKVPTQGALTEQAWLTRTLRHEYVHALLHERVGGRLGAIPTWLNEGLAMQFAGEPLPDIPELTRGETQLIPLKFLEGPWGAFPPKVAMVAYLEGNSATVYLIDRFSMDKVRELIGVIASGQPIAAAMQDRLFFPYDEFQRRWIDHLNEKIKTRRL